MEEEGDTGVAVIPVLTPWTVLRGLEMDGIISYEIRGNGPEMTKLDLRTCKILGRSRAVFKLKEKRVADEVTSSSLCDGLGEGG